MRRALYAGSFGQNPSKKGNWPIEERVAILFEYGLNRFCDFTLCVCCPIEQRRERVRKPRPTRAHRGFVEAFQVKTKA